MNAVIAMRISIVQPVTAVVISRVVSVWLYAFRYSPTVEAMMQSITGAAIPDQFWSGLLLLKQSRYARAVNASGIMMKSTGESLMPSIIARNEPSPAVIYARTAPDLVRRLGTARFAM